MRMIGLGCALGIVLTAISVSAQSISAEFCIQSDDGHAFIVLNRNTGDYKFTRCTDGVAFSGTGQLSSDGCFIFLNDTRENYKVEATVNMCVQAAKVAVDVPAPTPISGTQVPQMKVGFQDSNIINNPCSCEGAQAPPGDDGDPEFIGPPAEDPLANPAPKGDVTPPTELTVQSDSGHAFIFFNRNTGDYKFIRCADGVAFSGTGQVRIDGCFIFLEDSRDTYRVIVTVNICAQAAKVFVEAPQPTNTSTGVAIPAMSESFSDSSLSDSTASCPAANAKAGAKNRRRG
ncbi:MAG TPA: hypothetical protein VF131_17145 [Blastocatellia bacterium]|nr:hypothetical protein [Blastocatellia bacterium]